MFVVDINNKIRMHIVISFTVNKILIVLGLVVILFGILGLSGCRENRNFSFVRVGDFYAATGTTLLLFGIGV